MEKNQKINCNVYSCNFNNSDKHLCELNEIKVAACPNCNTGNPEDESMCASYRYNNNYQNK